jgi:hypothetical protein
MRLWAARPRARGPLGVRVPAHSPCAAGGAAQMTRSILKKELQ